MDRIRKTPIQKAFNTLALATVVLYIALGVIFFVLYDSNRARVTEGQNAHAAICLFIDDLKSRTDKTRDGIRVTREFITVHPHGTADFSRQFLDKSLNDQIKVLKMQESTIKSLSVADCS